MVQQVCERRRAVRPSYPRLLGYCLRQAERGVEAGGGSYVSARPQTMVGCSGATLPKARGRPKHLHLEYRTIGKGQRRNVKLLLPNFVRQVIHLPGRVLDLLEIAAYIFAADRLVSRGKTNALEF